MLSCYLHLKYLNLSGEPVILCDGQWSGNDCQIAENKPVNLKCDGGSPSQQLEWIKDNIR